MAIEIINKTGGPFPVTRQVGSSADHASLPNNCYFEQIDLNYLVRYKDSSGNITDAFSSAGGLTKFTEAESTTSPNNTVYVDSITAIGASTNVDIALVPKGSGAFLLAIPDNTTVGGNKRGLYSVDLQTAPRSVADQVCSGNYASLLGGYRSKANADHSIAGGNQNTASGFYSMALGGSGNTASGSFALAMGQSNNVSGVAGFGAGTANTNSGNYSAVFGYGNTISGAFTIRAGNGNTGNATYSITSGYNNAVSGTENGCFGSSSTVSGNYAFSLGYQNTASGLNSFTAGRSNTANNQYASVSGGEGNTSSGSHSFTSGYTNTASNTYSFALGNNNSVTAISSFGLGSNNTVSGGNGAGGLGYYNVTSGGTAFGIGLGNYADGDYSICLGSRAKAFGVQGRLCHMADYITTQGEFQTSEFILGKRTTDATQTTLSVNFGVASAINQVVLQNNNVFRFKGQIVGKESGSTNVGVWDFDGIIVRGSGAGTTTLVGTPTVTAISNLNSWGTPVISADTTIGCLKVEVIGLSATNIHWMCKVETTEAIYA